MLLFNGHADTSLPLEETWMDGKPKISAEGTYVFDEDELDQLDELSLTSVIGGTDTLAQRDQEPVGDLSESETVADQGDSTINELLRDPASDEPANDSSSATDSVPVLRGDIRRQDDSAVESSEDLIAPDLLFPELSDKSDLEQRCGKVIALEDVRRDMAPRLAAMTAAVAGLSDRLELRGIPAEFLSTVDEVIDQARRELAAILTDDDRDA